MRRTSSTPKVGVEERRYRVGQDRPSGTANKGVSDKFVAESSKIGLPGYIGVEQAKELIDDPSLTDVQVEEVAEQVRLMVEIMYEKWLQDRSQNGGEG